MTESSDLRRDISALAELADSRGWALIVEHLDKDVVAAAMALGTVQRMDADQISFRRGAIHAAQGFKDTPGRIIAVLQNELAMLAAKTGDIDNVHSLNQQTKD